MKISGWLIKLCSCFVLLTSLVITGCSNEPATVKDEKPVVFKTVGNSESDSQDWPQWRGPNRNGAVAESGIARRWSTDGPVELWRKSIGDGYAGIAISNGRVYTSYADADDEILVSLDAESGEELWRYRLNERFNEQFGNGPRSTPVVDGDRIYAMGSYGWLHAINLADGSKIWSLNIHSTFGNENAGYDRGYSCSPLIEGDMIIVNGGRDPEATIVALDKHSGETIWTYLNGGNSFSSQMAWDILGKRQIVSSIGYGMVGLDATNGKELWKYRWETSYNLNIAAPVFLPPNYLIISSGYDKGAAMVSLQNTDNEWRVQEVWQNRLFRNHFNSSVNLNGYVYGFDEKNLKCINAKTGEEQWASRDYGKGSLLLADDVLVVLSDKGKLALVDAQPDKYNELASSQVLSGKCWTMPSFSQGKVYLRNHKSLVALDLSSN